MLHKGFPNLGSNSFSTKYNSQLIILHINMFGHICLEIFRNLTQFIYSFMVKDHSVSDRGNPLLPLHGYSHNTELECYLFFDD